MSVSKATTHGTQCHDIACTMSCTYCIHAHPCAAVCMWWRKGGGDFKRVKFNNYLHYTCAHIPGETLEK